MKTRYFSSFFAAASVAVMASLGVTGQAQAEDYPKQPLTLVIPFQPGDTDSMLRPFMDRMQEYLGQPVVFNYKPGAGGGIGASYVASSEPDGYTLVGSSPGSIVVVPAANKEMRYSYDSFEPVAALTEGSLMLVVQSSKWKTLEELVADSRAKPEAITFSSSGALGITHLLAEAFAHEAELEWTHIPYQGSGPAIAALLGGHVDMASTAIAPAQGHIASGALRPLAVFGDKRMDAYPDVPTLKELGYAIGSPTLYGILAPKGTPRARVDAIYDAAVKIQEKYNDSISQSLLALGAQINVMGPDEYATYLSEQSAFFTRVVDTLN